MTQIRALVPSEVVAERVKQVRKRRGWSAGRLAEACAAAGSPELNRSVIANIESRRRKQVTLEELLTLAYVLDVAPIHLLVPIDPDETDQYRATPDTWVNVATARAWIRGDYCPPGIDPRTYWSEVPADEFRPEPPSAAEIEQGSERTRARRDIIEKFAPHAAGS